MVRLPVSDCGLRIEALEEYPATRPETSSRDPLNPTSEIQSPKLKRVLVVDDCADAAETLAELLELWGHEVRIASDGPAALRLAELFQPDVVLLDIGLPTMDGYDVARRLQSTESRPALLVALSGYGREEDRRRAKDEGFDYHFTKPVNPENLRKLVDD